MVAPVTLADIMSWSVVQWKGSVAKLTVAGAVYELGSHSMDNLGGNKLVGTFTRKDNGKVLKACREIVGDELVQVS